MKPDKLNYGSVKGKDPRHFTEYHMVLVPIHIRHQAHWTLGVMFPKTRKVAYLDSFRHSTTHPTRPGELEYHEMRLRNLFVDMHNHKFPTYQPFSQVNEEDVTVVQIKQAVQENGVDCGFHVMRACEFLTRGDFNLEQGNKHARDLFCLALIDKTLS